MEKKYHLQVSMQQQIHCIINQHLTVKPTMPTHLPSIKAVVENQVLVLVFTLTGKNMDTVMHMIIKCNLRDNKRH